MLLLCEATALPAALSFCPGAEFSFSRWMKCQHFPVRKGHYCSQHDPSMRVLCAPVSDKERSWKKGGEEKKEEMPLMASTLKVALAWMALQIDQSRAHARVHPAVLLPVEEGQESWRKQKRENRRLEQLSQVESCAGPSASKTPCWWSTETAVLGACFSFRYRHDTQKW